MDALTVHTGTGIPLRRSNVDTDQIIPAEYLKRITRHGFEDALFAAWRKDPEFVLNQSAYADASILIAGPDFGTGSSREHAVWALHDYGFRVVLGSRFADIFRGNSGKGGLLTAQVDQSVIERLWALVEKDPTSLITVDLLQRRVRVAPANSGVDFTEGDGSQYLLDEPFDVDDYVRYRFLNGLDDIGLTMQHVDEIAEFELSRPAFKPTVLS